METYIGKPLLMHLTLSFVFSFRSSTKHKNGTHFGAMDENGLKSIEKEKIPYSLTIENIKENDV